jgi:hypothetical protein
MVAARKAALAALHGDVKGAAASIAAWAGAPPERVLYLDAWTRLFLGWARRLVGRREEAEADLERARTAFARWKVPCGEIQAELELAVLDADRGRTAAAMERTHALRARHRCGQGALKNPMLAARLLAYQTRCLIESGPAEAENAVSLLMEAESYLIGRRLEDLEALVRELRRRIQVTSLAAPQSLTLYCGVPTDSSTGLEPLQSAGGAARDLIRRFEEEIGEERAEGLRRHLQNSHDGIARLG